MSNIDTFTLGNGQAAAGATNTGAPVKVGAAYNASAPTVGSGQVYDLQIDASGNLKVVIQNLTGAAVPVAVQGTVTVTGGGLTIQDGATFSRGTTLETSIGGVVDAAPPTLTAGKAAALSLTTSGFLNVNFASGGAAAGTAGTPSTDVLTIQGAPGIVPISVSQVPGLTPGTSLKRIVTAATTNLTSVKTSAGVVLGWALYNNTTTTQYVKIYDKASAPVLASDVPILTITLPTTSKSEGPFGSSGGLPLVNGFAYAITAGTGADTDTNAATVLGVTGTVSYL